MSLVEEFIRQGAQKAGVLTPPSAPPVGVPQQVVPLTPADAIREREYALALREERFAWERQSFEAGRWGAWGKLGGAFVLGAAVAGVVAWIGSVWRGRR